MPHRRSRRASMLCRALLLALALTALLSASAFARVLIVTKRSVSYPHLNTIQKAVNKARKGDWVLIDKGKYPETVKIKTAGLHLRGIDRNKVIVDGRHRKNVNGIEVSKANGVYIENLTVRNFDRPNSGGDNGNEIWWNGGDGSGKIGMGAWYGSYLSATSTYYSRKSPQATYGIFISNARGPGRLTDSYASNMNDASFYVGACQRCGTKLQRVHGQHSALGYSGTNSGGVLIENSEFDDNTSGIVTNSQNNDDAPSPQQGASFRNNYVHDNNNPNVPQKGTAESLSVVGAGIVVSGGRDNAVSGNRVEHNGSWGILLVPFLDIGNPPKVAHCEGGDATKNSDGTTTCYFDDWGNEVGGNKLAKNGFFGNPTNGDLGDVSGQHTPGNCWHGNTHPDGSGATSQPTDLQSAHADCGQPGHGDDITSELAGQVLCNTQLIAKCADDATHHYPRTKTITVRRLPAPKSMPAPCKGVPANAWCR